MWPPARGDGSNATNDGRVLPDAMRGTRRPSSSCWPRPHAIIAWLTNEPLAPEKIMSDSAFCGNSFTCPRGRHSLITSEWMGASAPLTASSSCALARYAASSSSASPPVMRSRITVRTALRAASATPAARLLTLAAGAVGSTACDSPDVDLPAASCTAADAPLHLAATLTPSLYTVSTSRARAPSASGVSSRSSTAHVVADCCKNTVSRRESADSSEPAACGP
mmetsp:Transcript_24752/g.86167  ORF Transcript_24752/g.86167 Transcript_24752/m.86167 type:complete len:223 (-) Transcript_24752:2120-2788(-)